MGAYERHVLPRLIHWTCGSSRMRPIRRPTVEGVHGTVLEIGFGSGPNVPLYPAAVERVLAVEPSGLGCRLAAEHLDQGIGHQQGERGQRNRVRGDR